MPALPSKNNLIQTGISKGTFKAALAAIWDYLAGLTGQDGTQKTALQGLGVILNGSRNVAGATAVTAADRGKVINCNGNFTVSVTDAAALGDGFAFAVLNSGGGTIVIDPALTQTIDGAATKALGPGKLAIVYCDGVKFVTVGSIATGDGSGLDADMLDGYHWNTLPYAWWNHGHDYSGVYAGLNAIVAISDFYESGSYRLCTATRANGSTFTFRVGLS